jgi:hypothetical protein
MPTPISHTGRWDTDDKRLEKISNNLVALFERLSNGGFTTGVILGQGPCRCTTAQIITAVNENIANFTTYLEGTGGVGLNPGVTTWAELQALATIGVIGTGTTILWVDSDTGLFKATQLRAGTDATDTANGVARPNDYSVSNERVWYSTT